MLIKPRRVRGAAAAKEWDHFSDDMRVRKILLGRQCTQRVRAVDRDPLWQQNQRFCASSEYMTNYNS